MSGRTYHVEVFKPSQDQSMSPSHAPLEACKLVFGWRTVMKRFQKSECIVELFESFPCSHDQGQRLSLLESRAGQQGCSASRYIARAFIVPWKVERGALGNSGANR